MVDGYGWSVQTDPLTDDAAVVTPEEASALGAMLNAVDPRALANDPATLHWLAGQLEIIARDPYLSRQFLANFDHWVPLCDELGGRRATLLGDPMETQPADVSALDAVFAGLAHVQRQALPTGDGPLSPSALLPFIDEMQPYSAALIVRSLGLDSATLAMVSDHLLQRWRSMSWVTDIDSPATDVGILAGPNTADILFTAMLADPDACTAFVRLAADDPDVLFASADDPTLASRVVLTATSPAQMTPGEAEAAVLSIIGYFLDGRHPQTPLSPGYDQQWQLFLVDLIAPWTVQFSPLNTEWSLSAERKQDILDDLLDDEAALQRLVDNADVVRDGALATLASGDSHDLEEFAAYLGLLCQLVTNQHVADAEYAVAMWQFMTGMLSVATCVVPIGMAAGVAVNLGLMIAGNLPPADPDRVRHDANYATEYTLTSAAAATVTAVYRQWLADGTLPAGHPPPPQPNPGVDHPAIEYERAFAAWVDQLDGGHDGALADRVVRLKDTLLNPATVGGTLAQ